MKIVHFAPFAPNACGLYEAARDMVIGDRISGHDALFVDVGVHEENNQREGKAGQKDERGGTVVESVDPREVMDADVIVAHTGIPDNWIVKCQAPMVWILHGRPTACFRPEQFGKRMSYSLIADTAKWQRTRAMVTFWDYHVKFWEPIIPETKLVNLSYPPIDEKRFSRKGYTHPFGIKHGRVNIGIAETLREDIDNYEITMGVVELSKQRNDVRFHFFSMHTPLRGWEYLLGELRKRGTLGEAWARIPNIQEMYRACDIMLSPQLIVTRTVGEALSCGTPVIAHKECSLATWKTNTHNPSDVARVISLAMDDVIYRKRELDKKVNTAAAKLSLSNYSKKMNKVYEGVCG